MPTRVTDPSGQLVEDVPHPSAARARSWCTAVLFAEPTYFDVEYVINPHMKPGTVDRSLARRQWESLVEVYRDLGLDVSILPAVEGLPDLVFIANQSLPTRRGDGSLAVVLSRMWAPQRRPEVEVVRRFFMERGYAVHEIEDEDTFFEGTGDAIWHPRRRLIYGGYGWRTVRRAYWPRGGHIDAHVIPIQLCDARFYHLDTCLAPLDENTACYVPVAFLPEGRALLERSFDNLIEVPLDEAVGALACNGHCPDGRHFIVDRLAEETMRRVQAAGFTPVPVDTSEFRKSGGSVQCLKLMLDE